ncbi:hypothetical protein BSL78_00177 [Apostichopus japonicus]|uniref:Uncharacterized protein n=1 Tax=Stichopus japonicus TaxID=307972 RepID=A0A2G8LRF1_STIJA|nr:hypothetical protein BSL78_00177 [Apostichopus japonicus]
MSSLRDCYSTALDLKEEIMQAMKKTNLPWPPTSDDLTLDAARKIVPTKLYNFIAWIVGVSDEPTDEQKVKIQDAEDHLPGNKGKEDDAQACIGLLNGFGHSVSHTNVLEHDTALGQQEIDRGMFFHPVSTSPLHHPCVGQQRFWRMHPIRKSRKRSLPAPASEMVRFGGLKKSSPQAFHDSVQLEVEHYNVVLHPYREKEDAFYVSKFSEARLLPSWTGFNQLLSSNIPPKATIAYLPVVDASPTDLNTVNTSQKPGNSRSVGTSINCGSSRQSDGRLQFSRRE